MDLRISAAHQKEQMIKIAENNVSYMDLTTIISKDVTQCATKMKYMLTLGPHSSDY
jgi:hypothetical protein